MLGVVVMGVLMVKAFFTVKAFPTFLIPQAAGDVRGLMGETFKTNISTECGLSLGAARHRAGGK